MTNKTQATPSTRPTKRPLSTWQIERIKEGIADALKGRVRPTEEVFAYIAAKHGWRLDTHCRLRRTSLQ